MRGVREALPFLQMRTGRSIVLTNAKCCVLVTENENDECLAGSFDASILLMNELSWPALAVKTSQGLLVNFVLGGLE